MHLYCLPPEKTINRAWLGKAISRDELDTFKRGLSRFFERLRAAELRRLIAVILIALKKDMEANGPVRGDWPNFSALSDNRYHCHLKKGRPTYVAIWEVIDKKIKLIEVTYAGTHEKAPY